MFKDINSGLSWKEKTAFFGLLFFAIFVIYLGFKQMKNTLRNPFVKFVLENNEKSPPKQSESAKMEELKKKDTDKDGLTDYDELYIYNTSPYLADSDSDGIDDKTEIDNKQDPNCPVGKNCGTKSAIVAADETGTGTKTVANNLFAGNLSETEQKFLQTLTTKNPDPKIIRQFLLDQGTDPNLVNQITDKELLSLFQTNSAQATSTVSPIISSSSTGQNEQVFSSSSLTPEQLKELRQMLLQKGVPVETLNKLNDKALLDLIKDL